MRTLDQPKTVDAKRLYQIRIDYNLTAQSLAQKLGLSVHHINKIQNGQRKLNKQSLMLIKYKFGGKYVS